MSSATPTGAWTSVIVAGHECLCYEPPVLSEHGYAVLYLHDLYQGMLSDHQAVVQHFDCHGLRVISPLSKRSWWTDRICPEFDQAITAENYLLEKVVPYLAEAWDCTPPQIALLGPSMGGQGVLRLAYKHPQLFPVVAAVFPSIDHQIRFDEGDRQLAQMYRDAEDVRQDTATLHIHPLNWPRHQWFCCDPTDYRWHDSADRLRMKLFSLGVPHECDLETSAGGHTWEYFEHMAECAIGFLVNGLEQERLRVV